MTLALEPEDARGVTYAHAFAKEVRLVGLPNDVGVSRGSETDTFDAGDLGGKPIAGRGERMTAVVIASADQSLVFQLNAALQEMDGVQVLQAVDSTEELVAAVLRLDPDLVLVHDELGPNPAHQVVRDIGLRRPTCCAVMVTARPSPRRLRRRHGGGRARRGELPHLVRGPAVPGGVRGGRPLRNMRRVLAATSAADSGPGRARVVTFVGAKGGVGTTTVATHLALDLVPVHPGPAAVPGRPGPGEG